MVKRPNGTIIYLPSSRWEYDEQTKKYAINADVSSQVPLKTWQIFYHEKYPEIFKTPLPKGADWEESMSYEPEELTVVEQGTTRKQTFYRFRRQEGSVLLHPSRVDTSELQINLMNEEEIKEKAEIKAKLHSSIRFVHKDRMTVSELERSTEHSIVIGVPLPGSRSKY